MWKRLQIGTYMLLIITSTGDRLFGFVNIDDLGRFWTLKILILSDFLAIFGRKRVNCDEMDGDRLRLPANRNCYRLSRVSWALLKLLVTFMLWTACRKRHRPVWESSLLTWLKWRLEIIHFFVLYNFFAETSLGVIPSIAGVRVNMRDKLISFLLNYGYLFSGQYFL